MNYYVTCRQSLPRSRRSRRGGVPLCVPAVPRQRAPPPRHVRGPHSRVARPTGPRAAQLARGPPGTRRARDAPGTRRARDAPGPAGRRRAVRDRGRGETARRPGQREVRLYCGISFLHSFTDWHIFRHLKLQNNRYLHDNEIKFLFPFWYDIYLQHHT